MPEIRGHKITYGKHGNPRKQEPQQSECAKDCHQQCGGGFVKYARRAEGSQARPFARTGGWPSLIETVEWFQLTCEGLTVDEVASSVRGDVASCKGAGGSSTVKTVPPPGA